MDKIEKLLEIFSLEELLEMMDVTEPEVLDFLVRAGICELPEVFEDLEIEAEYE